jgi:hypothetical protein
LHIASQAQSLQNDMMAMCRFSRRTAHNFDRGVGDIGRETGASALGVDATRNAWLQS